jgi:hypothetical protein
MIIDLDNFDDWLMSNELVTQEERESIIGLLYEYSREEYFKSECIEDTSISWVVQDKWDKIIKEIENGKD